MPRPKSFSNLSAKELQDLREALASEEARRQLLSTGNEAIKACVESIRTVARNLKVTDHDLLEVVVTGMLGDGFAVYLKRGRAVGTVPRKPGRPKKVKK
jgi:hypothetical protein